MTILKRLMEVKHLSNIELSKKTGLSKFEISRLRNGSREAKLSTIKKVAIVLDVPIKLLARKEGKHD